MTCLLTTGSSFNDKLFEVIKSGITSSNSLEEHTHTVSDITDLTITDTIKVYTAVLTKGTKDYFNLSCAINGSYIDITLTPNDNFVANPLSQFNIESYNGKDGTWYDLTLGYSSDNGFSLVEDEYQEGEFTVNAYSFTIYSLDPSKEDYILAIYDSEWKGLSYYGLVYSEVDSSNLLTFGAIDDAFARKEHTHTKSDITDLKIFTSIIATDSYTVTLNEGTEYFDLTCTKNGSRVDLKFTINDNFDADKFSEFTVDANNTKMTLSYSDGKFSDISSDFWSFSLGSKIQLYYLNLPLTITITDSESNVLTKYTVEYAVAQSSDLLTYGAIDETYAKITELESLKTTIEELTARITALETNA